MKGKDFLAIFFPNAVLTKWQIRSHTCTCMYLTGGLFDKEDPYRYAYGCLNTKGEMEVACEANELMTIHSVLYGGEPNGCNSDIRKDNGCLQYRYDAKSCRRHTENE